MYLFIFLFFAGYDFANVENGFVYHTRFDNGHLVPTGSYQHTGDNILALVLALANSPDLESNNSSGPGGSMVYFDFFGLFFVCYTKLFGTVLNSVVALMSLCTILCLLLRKKIGKDDYPFLIITTFGEKKNLLIFFKIFRCSFVYLGACFFLWICTFWNIGWLDCGNSVHLFAHYAS